MPVMTPPFLEFTSEIIHSNNAVPKDCTYSKICNVRISNVITDGSGLSQTVRLPTPPLDINFENTGANDQLHVIAIQTLTNAADRVLIECPPGNVNLTGFDGALKVLLDLHNVTLGGFFGAGEFIVFRWTGFSWNLENPNGSFDQDTPCQYIERIDHTNAATTRNLKISENGHTIVNDSSGNTVLTLPDTTIINLNDGFQEYNGVMVAGGVGDVLQFTAHAGDTIQDGATISVAGGNIKATSQPGATLCLRCFVPHKWMVWTKSQTWVTT